MTTKNKFSENDFNATIGNVMLGDVFFEDKIKYQITAYIGLDSFLIINDSTKKFHYSPLVVLKNRLKELKVINEQISEENLIASKKFVSQAPNVFNARF